MDSEEVTISHTDETSLAGAHTNNESTLSVDDASPFVGMVGESIRVYEDQTPYGYTSNIQGDPTVEYATIASVDEANDTIDLEYPLHHPYPDTAATAVESLDWEIDDIRITNLTVLGDSSASVYLSTVYLRDVHKAWLDDLRIEGSANDGMLLRVSYSHLPRIDNIDFNNGDRYGLDVVRGTTDACATNLSATNIARYVARWGRPPPGPVGGFGYNINGNGFDNFTVNAHHGAYHTDFEEVHGDGAGVLRIRSHDLILDGFTEENSSHYTFLLGQIPSHCTIKNGTVTNKVSSSVFHSDVGHENWSTSYLQDVTFENIEIDAYDGRGPGDIGSFTGTGNGTTYDDLTFRDILYDGEYLTQADVENWNNFDHHTFNNLTVETT